ncbi:hypothetical protein [Nostoc sp.]
MVSQPNKVLGTKFSSQCPMPNAQCPMPNTPCSKIFTHNISIS